MTKYEDDFKDGLFKIVYVEPEFVKIRKVLEQTRRDLETTLEEIIKLESIVKERIANLE